MVPTSDENSQLTRFHSTHNPRVSGCPKISYLYKFVVAIVRWIWSIYTHESTDAKCPGAVGLKARDRTAGRKIESVFRAGLRPKLPEIEDFRGDFFVGNFMPYNIGPIVFWPKSSRFDGMSENFEKLVTGHSANGFMEFCSWLDFLPLLIQCGFSSVIVFDQKKPE